MASTARIDELKKKFDENPRRYFAPLANEFRKAGEIEQAIMICEEFLPQQPGHMSGHIVYGQALFEASRFEESRTVFETALTLDPENLIALRHLGDIARGQGDLEAARRWYDRVLDADPRNEEILSLIAALGDAPSAVLPAVPSAMPADPSPSTRTPAFPDHSTEQGRFAPPSMPVAAPPPEPIDLDARGDDVASMPEVREVEQPVAEMPASGHARAEGLESVEFTPPTGPVDRARDLGSSLEPGEFTAPASPVAPLAGLEENALEAFERSVPDGGPALPMLDTSEALAPRADAPRDQNQDRTGQTVEFTVPSVVHRATDEPQRGSTVPEMQFDRAAAEETRNEMPPELPPSVIAAEAELLAADETEEAASVKEAALSAPAAPFVTATMAELFVRQGFREQALDVYRQLLASNPSDEGIRARIAQLQPPAPAAAGDSVRDFLARFATRRPGERGAAVAPPSNDDFVSFERIPSTESAAPAAIELVDVPPPSREAPAPAAASPAATVPRVTPSAPMSTGIERGASTQGAAGSIDALFGNRAAGTSEDSAASALAQAFGGAAEQAPAISGRPTRAAAGELSLDSVFRDGPPRPPRASQSFSFDQFFSPDSATPEKPAAASSPTPTSDPTAPTEPAERNADDIEQFNSWLQGLKPK